MPKKKKVLLGILIPVAVILVFVALCFSTYIPRVKGTDYESAVVKANPLISKETLVSAHRAGRTLAPENTMAAFKACFESMKTTDPEKAYTVDVLEFDLHLTKDEKLVLLHDDTLDRTSDSEAVFHEKDVKPIDKNLSELLQCNMGYNFQDPVTGEYPYRKADADLTDVRIVTLEQVLAYVESQETELGIKIGYIIEIKNGKDEKGDKAADLLATTLKNHGLLDRTVVGTFHGEISKYLDEKHPEVTRSAGIMEVLSFYFGYIFNVPLDNVKYKVLQIPYKDFVINLGKKGMVDYAHKYGIAVQYWTINKAEDIDHLSSIGADAIMSDNPKLCYDIVNGKK